MKKKDVLGQFEQLVLTSVFMSGEDAYGMAIHENVEQLGNRTVKLPSVYVVLDRLEQKGYVRSWTANSTPERGNRRSRYFRMLVAGERALADSAATSERLMNAWKTAKWFKRAR